MAKQISEADVERVARALCQSDITRDSEEDLQRAVGTLWPHYAAAARCAIEALADAVSYAELVEALNSALEMVLEASQSGNFSTEEYTRCNALIAKVRGEQVSA